MYNFLMGLLANTHWMTSPWLQSKSPAESGKSEELSWTGESTGKMIDDSECADQPIGAPKAD
jgi:hypothetical protein